MIVQSVEPFVSTHDISAGDRFLNTLASELQETSFGIVCLTRKNILTPWITFEAGAMSRMIETGKIVPLLLDLKPSDLTGPLAQFQAVNADSEREVFNLIRVIADTSAPPRITDTQLKATFDAFWPSLEAKVAELASSDEESDSHDKRADRDLLEEILLLVRASDRKTYVSSQRGKINRLKEELKKASIVPPYLATIGPNNCVLQYPDELMMDDIDAASAGRILEILARLISMPIEVTGGPLNGLICPPF